MTPNEYVTPNSDNYFIKYIENADNIKQNSKISYIDQMNNFVSTVNANSIHHLITLPKKFSNISYLTKIKQFIVKHLLLNRSMLS